MSHSRVVVVTGGGDGIGAMVVRRLASEGWSVCVADIDETSATAIAADLTDRGHRVIGVGADVSCEADVERIGEVAETELGALSGWINNAGNTSPSMLLKMEVDAFDSVLAVHARGSFLGVREAARRMVRSESGGAIINVTSSAGLGGTVGQINYASAKGAIIAMTKSAAKELGRYNIRVNAVAPSASTEMTRTIMTNEKFAKTYLSRIALGRFAEADEMSATFSFLLSDDAGYMTGQVLSIDGGTYMVS